MSDPTPLGLARDLILAVMRGPLELTPTQAALAVIRRELRFALGTEDRPGKWEKLHDLLLNLSDPCALPQGDTTMSEPTPYYSHREIAAVFAKSAVEISPYPCPENLDLVLRDLAEQLEAQWPGKYAPGYAEMQPDAVHTFLGMFIRMHPAVRAWNEPKKGNPGAFVAVTRYDAPRDPDTDFMDLGALHGNVVNTLRAGTPYDWHREREGLEQQLREAHDFVEAVKKERDEARQQLDNVAQAYGFLLDEHRTLSDLLSGAFAPSDVPGTLRERVERVMDDLETLRGRRVVTTAPFEGHTHPDGFREGDPALNTATKCLRNLTGLLRELQRDGLGPRYGLGAARIRVEKAISALEDYQRRAGVVGEPEGDPEQLRRTTVTIHAVGGRKEVTKQVLAAIERTFAQQAAQADKPQGEC